MLFVGFHVTTPLGPRTNHPLLMASLIAAFGFMPALSRASSPEVRVTRQVVDSDRVVLQGTRPLLARADRDVGRLSKETVLKSVTITFGRTAAQEADLQALLAAQQDPSSPLYQVWLTPEKYAARFGVADSDIAKVKAWLAEQGLEVESVSRSRNSIRFTGTVGQIEAAFRTELHYYQHGDKTDFAPSTEVSVPAAIAPIVLSVRGLTSARPRPHFQQGDVKATARPLFTSGISGGHFLGPADVATIYDVTPAYGAGLTGKGQTIVVVGQSTIVLADLENFQSAAHPTNPVIKDPVLVPVPNSNSAAAPVQGDESESDLDLEWSSAMAPGATIKFVYANGSNQSVWNALEYAGGPGFSGSSSA